MRYLTADFGSTYTKVTAIDTSEKKILATGSAFTTIEDDVMFGLADAINDLHESLGEEWEYDRFLCCSSAAGGLKMVAVGLVPELTAKAARLAASSAGAKVVKTYSYELTHRETKEITEIAPDLILLCGGTDGGNKEVIVHNAQMLTEVPGKFTTVIAGNKAAEEEVEAIFKKSGRPYVLTENVMPNFNVLNILPAKQCITQLFIDSIIHAKGLSKAQEQANNEIIPTPLAVLNACELLSKGTRSEKGLGELLAIDLGGATTDVYSIAKGDPTAINIIQRGLPEPESKRTVEGDLGMRYSLTSLADELDLYAVGDEKGLSHDALEAWVKQCSTTPATRSQNEREEAMEMVLAKGAIRLAVERHVGVLKSTYTPAGQIFTIDGKDLSEIPQVLGIGGALVHADDPKFVLSGTLYDPRHYEFAKPKAPNFLLDASYIMASMGLLSQEEPDVALHIMKERLKQL